MKSKSIIIIGLALVLAGLTGCVTQNKQVLFGRVAEQ